MALPPRAHFAGTRRVGPVQRLDLAILLAFLLGLGACSSGDREAAEGDPRPDRAALREARAIRRGGDLDRARRAYEELVARRPDDVLVLRELHSIRVEQFETEALVGELEERVAAAPEQALWHYLLGRLLWRHEEQEGCFRRAVAADPGWPWGHYGLAWVEVQRGDLAAAQDHLGQALRADPMHAPSLDLQGRVLASQGLNDRARQAFLAALRADADGVPAAEVSLAQIAEKQGRRLEKIQALRAAIRLDSYQADAIEGLARVARADPAGPEGRIAASALEDLAARRDRDDGDLPAVLAAVREASGDRQGAFAAAGRSLEDQTFWSLPSQIRRRCGMRQPAATCAEYLQGLGLPTESLIPALRELGPALLRLEAATEGDAETLAAALGTMERAGWHREALALAALRSESQAPVCRAVLERITSHLRVVDALVLLAADLGKGLETEAAADLGRCLERIRGIVELEAGEALGGTDVIRRIPMVGELLDPAAVVPGGLSDYFLSRGQILFVGRLAGEASQILLMNRVSGPREIDLAGGGAQEIVGENVVVRPEDPLFGETAGRALFSSYYLDLDVVSAWKRRLSRATRLPAAIRERLLAARGPRVAGSIARKRVDRPYDAAESLLLKSFEIHGELPLQETVRSHEQGHVIDARRFLPIEEHLLACLMLVAQGGFDAVQIMSILEETAQRHALIHGPSPHLVLTEIVQALPRGPAAGAHAIGYRRLLERFLIVLDRHLADFPQIDPEHLLITQLHLLGEDDIRRLAAEI